MPTYVMLMNFTRQGITGIRDIPEGIAGATEYLEGMGGKAVALYLVMGEYDLVGICEMPSDEAVAAFVLQLGAWGNVKTKTLKAFNVEQFAEIVGALPEEEEG